MRISDWSADVCSSDLQRDDQRALVDLLGPEIGELLVEQGGSLAHRLKLFGHACGAIGCFAQVQPVFLGHPFGGRQRQPLQCIALRLKETAKVDRPRPDRSEEHTSELQSLMRISYAVFCLKKKNNNTSAITSAT